MATDYKAAAQSEGSEHQNLRAVNSFESRKGGQSTLN